MQEPTDDKFYWGDSEPRGLGASTVRRGGTKGLRTP